jgi:FemAB-related protein (PEP-CTERM system-associated)
MTIAVNSPQHLAGGPITIRYARDEDGPAWDSFVFASPEATFFHRFGWRAIFRDIFHLKPQYLIAESTGKIVGILPLVHQKSLLFGNALISAPFCVEGGPVATDIESRRILDEAAISLMHALKAQSLEFRSRTARRAGWTVRNDLYATFARDLSSDNEENLRAIPRKQRAVVRKTLKSNLSSHIEDNVDALFRVYSESVRNLGTPVFSKRYFAALRETFGDDCDIVVIREDAEPFCAVMNFYFRDTVMPYYGGGRTAARHNGANDFLYWEVMRRAAARGFRRFDFGRSKAETGAFAFKKNWGFEPQWLEYEYYLPPGAALPDKNPNNPKYASVIALWKRLPLPVANLIGPFLVRGLG